MKLLASHPRYRALSKEGQASVRGRLVATRSGEGEPSDRDIAVALSAFAEGQATFAVVEGGRHKAIQNPDGTWDVLDVPVFSEIPEGVKRAPKPIGKAELEEAVRLAWSRRIEDSFVPSLHVLHNDRSRAEFAGYFFPKAVRTSRLEGKERATIFADLLSVPDPVFRRMERGELPHRSVEVRTYEPLEFSSLALLDTEDPFWRYPLLTIGERIELPERRDVTLVTGDALVSLAVAGERVAACFRFEEEPAKEPEKEEDGEAPPVEPAEEARFPGGR